MTATYLGPADALNRSLLVHNGDLADLSVQLEEDFTLASVLTERADCQELQDEDLALLELDVELLANLRLGQEVASGQHREVTELVCPLLVVLKHLGVHDVGSNISLRDGGAILLREVLLDLGEVDRLEEETRALVELSATTESVCAERLGEAARRLTDETLEEVEDTAGEVELLGASLDVLGAELVRDHELGEVTTDLGGRGDLDNVTEKLVGLSIGLLGLEPLGAETNALSLEHHVRELTTRDLVLVHLRIRSGEVGLEGRVEKAELLPVDVQSTDLRRNKTRVELAALKRGDDGVDAGL
jgi:hypothetical protein